MINKEEYFNLISNDKQGNYCREKYLSNNHNELYNEIINHTKLDIPFKEKVYFYFHNLTEIPKCSNCNINNTNYRNFNTGYNTLCSANCKSKKDPIPKIPKEKVIKEPKEVLPKEPKQPKEQVEKKPLVVFQNNKTKEECEIDYNNTKEEIFNFVYSNYDGLVQDNVNLLTKTTEPIFIYLEEQKLAIEYVDLYLRNELFVNSKYHFKRTEECEQLGIKIIHIYQDEWLSKKEIVKSRLLNLIGKTPNKIFARKCKIKTVQAEEARVFLNKCHIQGYVNASAKIGLYYEDKLVSIITLGALRKSLGQKDTENKFELLRFCNELNTNVIGAASKLFKEFIKQNPTMREITTYACRSWSNGALYETLGFKFIHKTDPNYHYVVNNERKHRFGFRKDKLLSDGFDPNLGEHEIMLCRGIYRVFNSGNYKFIYYNNEEK